jgi:apolipoprotein D and lipocalin family protein
MAQRLFQAKKLALALVLALIPAASQAQTAKAMPHLDGTQISGAWYQIARYPNKREKKCISDAYELIARAEKPHQLSFVDSCKTKAPYAAVQNYNARRQDKKIVDGRLKITTIWPFTRKYWILAADPQFDWFLAGTPDHKNLWIYAKIPTMSPDILQQVEAIAATDGFSAIRLKMTPQTGNNTPSKQMIAQ